MGLDRAIDITAEQRKIVLALLERHLPNTTAWVYGSRAKWTSRPQSDLDVVVFATPEQNSRVSDLREAFEESNLPFRVDLFVWDEVPEQFRRHIEAEHAVLVEREERDYVVVQKGSDEEATGSEGEWRELSFSEAVLINPTVRLERGMAYPFVDMAAVSADSRSVYATEEREFKGGGSRFQNDDTLMARITPCLENGKIARYSAPEATSGAHGSTEFIVIRGLPNVTDNDFAYYLTKWDEVREYAISQMTGTSGRQRVPTDSLDYLIIPLPPLPGQRAIAHILGTLDDKIELNRRMTETLEEMARALFKSWFVDFDPVRAKAALKRSSLVTPPLRGSRQAKGVSPQARRWGEIKRRYAPQTLQKARTLRQTGTDAEGLLWHFLRNKQLDGYKFRRQQPIGPYVADFACMSRKLLIELDGGQHAERRAYDEKRDNFLQEKGYRVLRFWNGDVFENCLGVLERVYEALTFPPPHQPSPVGSASATPPQGGSDWSVERARAYLDGMDDSIAALFPDRLVDSELGPIPEGWEVKAFDQIADFRNGLALQKFRPTDNKNRLPVVKIAQLRSGKADSGEWAAENITPECIIDDGDIVFSWSGSLMVKIWCGGRAALNQHLFKVTSSEYPDWFCLHCIESHLVEFQSIASDKTTTMGHIKRQHLSEAKCAVPYPNRLAVANVTFADLLSKRISNVLESNALATFRDTLLPKLMSGELRAQDAKKLTEAIA